MQVQDEIVRGSNCIKHKNQSEDSDSTIWTETIPTRELWTVTTCHLYISDL